MYYFVAALIENLLSVLCSIVSHPYPSLNSEIKAAF